MSKGETDVQVRAEIRLPTQKVRADIPFYTETLKMRMTITCSDDSPVTAVWSQCQSSQFTDPVESIDRSEVTSPYVFTTSLEGS
ncbi:hypothetical protein [Shimia sp.]|uniref:hypothetical protein n=1 Tax=Shimia sp. TaxID=1954381 RepID=UPI0032976E9C